MERLGLATYFPPGQGAFGCEREQRTELFALALERAGRLAGGAHRRRRRHTDRRVERARRWLSLHRRDDGRVRTSPARKRRTS
jgi:hypothetical protein